MTAISKIRNIAIIGAGPAGLAAAKYGTINLTYADIAYRDLLLLMKLIQVSPR